MKSEIKKIFLIVLTIVATVCCGMMVELSVRASANSYTIYVNRQSNIVNVVDDHTNKVVRAMYCSTGKDNGTITGTFQTEEKYRWHALFGDVFVFEQDLVVCVGGRHKHLFEFFRTSRHQTAYHFYFQYIPNLFSACFHEFLHPQRLVAQIFDRRFPASIALLCAFYVL